MFQKKEWKNKPSEETPLGATGLNNLEERISDGFKEKVDKEEGKKLSTNDYTDEEKTKLSTLQNYDDTQVQKDISQNIADISEIKEEQVTQNNNISKNATSITFLQEEQTQQNTDIESLQTENMQMKEKIKMLEENQIPRQ